MSHYTTLAIVRKNSTRDVEDILAPYDENGETHDVQWGLALIEDAMAYPFEHDVSEEEAAILHKLFNRCGITVRTV